VKQCDEWQVGQPKVLLGRGSGEELDTFLLGSVQQNDGDI
jgi:hypothetical protein